MSQSTVRTTSLHWDELETRSLVTKHCENKDWKTVGDELNKDSQECIAWYEWLLGLESLLRENGILPKTKSKKRKLSELQQQQSFTSSGPEPNLHQHVSNGVSNNNTHNNGTSTEDEASRKRQRRCAKQIDRKFKCPATDCPRAYGTEGALKYHFKNKHKDLSYSDSCRTGGTQPTAIRSSLPSMIAFPARPFGMHPMLRLPNMADIQNMAVPGMEINMLAMPPELLAAGLMPGMTQEMIQNNLRTLMINSMQSYNEEESDEEGESEESTSVESNDSMTYSQPLSQSGPMPHVLQHVSTQQLGQLPQALAQLQHQQFQPSQPQTSQPVLQAMTQHLAGVPRPQPRQQLSRSQPSMSTTLSSMQSQMAQVSMQSFQQHSHHLPPSHRLQAHPDQQFQYRSQIMSQLNDIENSDQKEHVAPLHSIDPHHSEAQENSHSHFSSDLAPLLPNTLYRTLEMFTHENGETDGVHQDHRNSDHHHNPGHHIHEHQNNDHHHFQHYGHESDQEELNPEDNKAQILASVHSHLHHHQHVHADHHVAEHVHNDDHEMEPYLTRPIHLPSFSVMAQVASPSSPVDTEATSIDDWS